jgi:hypothetical protein
VRDPALCAEKRYEVCFELISVSHSPEQLRYLTMKEASSIRRDPFNFIVSTPFPSSDKERVETGLWCQACARVKADITERRRCVCHPDRYPRSLELSNMVAKAFGEQELLNDFEVCPTHKGYEVRSAPTVGFSPIGF